MENSFYPRQSQTSPASRKSKSSMRIFNLGEGETQVQSLSFS